MSQTEVKADRKYTVDHEWFLEEEGSYRVGVTAFAVDQLGDITLVDIDVAVGDAVEAGKPFGTIESVKTLSDLIAPVDGKIVEINAALEEQPELVNDDPWDAGWMVRIEPSGDLSALLEPDAYSKHLEDSDS